MVNDVFFRYNFYIPITDRVFISDEDIDDNENNQLANIFSSDLGVSLATESLYQIAEIRLIYYKYIFSTLYYYLYL